MDVFDLLLASLIICLGSAIQTAFGFGIAVFSAPLLILIDPALVPGPIVLAAMVQCILMAWQNRRTLEPSGLTMAFVGRIPGSLVGVLILSWVSTQYLSIGVGIIVLLAVVFSLGKYKVLPTPKTMFWASFASGFLGSSTSVGGPPMALLMQHEKATAVRGNLAGYFIYGCFISMIGLIAVGRFGLRELELCYWLVPAAVIGFYLCKLLPIYRLGDNLRPVILSICTICGVVAIIEGVFFS